MQFISVLKCNITLLRNSVIIVTIVVIVYPQWYAVDMYSLRLLIVLTFCACMQICICVTVHMFAYVPGIVTVSVVDEIADDLRLFLSNSREPISG